MFRNFSTVADSSPDARACDVCMQTVKDSSTSLSPHRRVLVAVIENVITGHTLPAAAETFLAEPDREF